MVIKENNNARYHSQYVTFDKHKSYFPVMIIAMIWQFRELSICNLIVVFYATSLLHFKGISLNARYFHRAKS